MRPGAVLDSMQEEIIYWTFSSRREQRFLNFHRCLLRLMVTLFAASDRVKKRGQLLWTVNELKGFRPLSSKIVSAFFFSRQSRVSGWPRVWIMTSLRDVLKLSSPQAAIKPSQGEALKCLWRRVSLSEETSCHFFIPLFLAQRKWK